MTELITRHDGHFDSAWGSRHDPVGSGSPTLAVSANASRRRSRFDQISAIFVETPPVGRFGERFHSSETGHLFLGEIPDRATGRFGDFGCRPTRRLGSGPTPSPRQFDDPARGE